MGVKDAVRRDLAARMRVTLPAPADVVAIALRFRLHPARGPHRVKGSRIVYDYADPAYTRFIATACARRALAWYRRRHPGVRTRFTRDDVVNLGVMLCG